MKIILLVLYLSQIFAVQFRKKKQTLSDVQNLKKFIQSIDFDQIEEIKNYKIINHFDKMPQTVSFYYNPDEKTFSVYDQIFQFKDHLSILCAQANFNQTIEQIGWNKLNINTFKDCPVHIQYWGAGYLEGLLTQAQMENFFDNLYKNKKQYQAVQSYFSNQNKNLKELTKNQNIQNQQIDQIQIYYAMVSFQRFHIEGIYQGYKQFNRKFQPLNLNDVYFLNSDGQINEIKDLISQDFDFIRYKQKQKNSDWIENLFDKYNVKSPKELWNELLLKSRCSAIIKYIDNQNEKDVIVSHATFDSYQSMIRIFKNYYFEFLGENSDFLPVQQTFSSYPGAITSTDDYYSLNSQLVVLETTTGVLDNNRYVYKLDDKLYIPDFMRISITNQLSKSGVEWSQWFQIINTGTYNSHWMILDYNQFDQGIQNTFFIVLEQSPGEMIVQNMTEQLIKTGYWGSFNVPYFQKTRDNLGFSDMTKKFGLKAIDYDFEHNSRNLYLQKQIQNVKNIKDIQTLIQSDPISPRADDRLFGSIDAKIINSKMIEKQEVLAISGPSHLNQKPFSWKQNPSTNHYGIPNLMNFDWYKFQPIGLQL